MAVESYGENNLTATIVSSTGTAERRGPEHYWLGLASLDDLRTNTLESAAGTLVSQYSGVYILPLLVHFLSLDFTDPVS